jgi:hypothetical protein
VTKGSTAPDLRPWPRITLDFRVETLRMRMHEYSITFAADVNLASAASEHNALHRKGPCNTRNAEGLRREGRYVSDSGGWDGSAAV